MVSDNRVNELGQPIGRSVPDWKGARPPAREAIAGQYCRLEPLTERHAPGLWDAYAHAPDHRNWTYLYDGPFASPNEFASWVARASVLSDQLFFAVMIPAGAVAAAELPVGVASYLRIAPDAGSIEVGSINFSPLLQRTRAATEAMYLMMRRAFELGYRRYEWKCDALNAPSRAAAERLGFTYEGLFRQAAVYKGRNRDTAWYAIVDTEWPALKIAFEHWLSPANFDAAGQQRSPLSTGRRSAAPRFAADRDFEDRHRSRPTP